ncbi:Response regulator receiver domain protein [Novipirellula aureliae]|uniref:Response regulator receiver domain protein n=2 Tax=Novipirellula aureliae TaxID=2527966 RepID=A0A5C6E324_9BACT|nr:Response regulator receiver domain protein [Novipirellula aureliae]
MRNTLRPDDGSGPGDAREGTFREGNKKNASVLIVDPSPLSLIAVAGVLHYYGYMCTCARTAKAAHQATSETNLDLLIWDVADDAAGVLESLAQLRRIATLDQLPAVLLAESRWAGLEKKTQSLSAATRTLFKPIDPDALMAVVDHLLWMPTLISAHRKRGAKPSRTGWVTLE